MVVGGLLRERSHGSACVGVFETVYEHMIVNAGMTKALTGTPCGHQVWRIRHAFEPTGDCNPVGAGTNAVDSENSGLHAASAGFVDRHCADVVWESGISRRLAGRTLL